MNTKSTLLSLTFAAMLLLVATTQSYALNYTISFTASGVTTSVGSVQVQNLTKKTTVTVPNYNTLTLTDQTTADDAISVNDGGLRITQNARTGTSILTFYAGKAGSAQVDAYAIDGRKVVGQTSRLEAGYNSLELSLPAGMYVLRVSGTGYFFSAKLQSHGSVTTQTGIKFMSNTKVEVSASHKSKATPITTTTMTYSTGDQLLYIATSGAYIAYLSDVPIESKTTNFTFYNIPTAVIPTGTFTMGSPITEAQRHTDETQHSVTLTTFRISKYEITNSLYADFLNAKGIGSNGIYAKGKYPTQKMISASWDGFDWGLHYNGSQWIPVSGYENAPVICVTWYGATEYASYVGGTLPTEAQWEYACRAGTTTTFNTGNSLTNLQSNYGWGIFTGKTMIVGSYSANAYGLYDMHGNVREWCSDWENGTAYSTTPQTNPTGPSTGYGHIVRGGGWEDYADHCRSAERNSSSTEYFSVDLGFRVVFLQ